LGKFESRLTARRLEALDALQRLTTQAGEAVHYSLVATRMRISTWTAYGLLRELETLGLVTRRSAPPTHSASGGRSRIMFLPSAAPAAVPSPDALETQLRAAFDQIQAEMRSQYNIGYTPTNNVLDGSFRKLELKTKEGYKIQTRAGYYAQKPKN